MKRALLVFKTALSLLICLIFTAGASGINNVNKFVYAALYTKPAGPEVSVPEQADTNEQPAEGAEETVSTAASAPQSGAAESTPAKAPPAQPEPEPAKAVQSPEKRAVWISFLEYQKILNGKTEKQFKSSICKYFDSCAEYGLNTVIVQARSHSDAYYKSAYFPASLWFTEKRKNTFPFDPLKIMVDEAHKRGLKIEAWVNPYRGNKISEEFAENDIIKAWLDTDKVFACGEYYYLNPGEPEVMDYVVNGITEIVENYDIDGIHFDDYFYPAGIGGADAAAYEKYGGGKTVAEFRTDCVNRLVSRVYSEIKARKNIVFGISPAGNIDNCLNKSYADVRLWGSADGYADYLAPQLYWDYGQGVLPYEKALENWKKTVKNSNVKLIVGLAPYRVTQGNGDVWNAGDILKRQVSDARSAANYGGFIMFRYDFFFSDTLKTERDNLKGILG